MELRAAAAKEARALEEGKANIVALRRKSLVKRALYYTAAASVIVLLSLSIFFYNSNTGSEKFAADFIAENPNITTNISQIFLDETKIIIYPNPFSSQTTIAFTEEQKNSRIKK